MKMTIAYLANSEGCMLSPSRFSHLREPLMLTPMPGMSTSTSSSALTASRASMTRFCRSARYGTRDKNTHANAPSPTPISCFFTAASGSPVTVLG